MHADGHTTSTSWDPKILLLVASRTNALYCLSSNLPVALMSLHLTHLVWINQSVIASQCEANPSTLHHFQVADIDVMQCKAVVPFQVADIDVMQCKAVVPW